MEKIKKKNLGTYLTKKSYSKPGTRQPLTEYRSTRAG